MVTSAWTAGVCPASVLASAGTARALDATATTSASDSMMMMTLKAKNPFMLKKLQDSCVAALVTFTH